MHISTNEHEDKTRNPANQSYLDNGAEGVVWRVEMVFYPSGHIVLLKRGLLRSVLQYKHPQQRKS